MKDQISCQLERITARNEVYGNPDVTTLVKALRMALGWMDKIAMSVKFSSAQTRKQIARTEVEEILDHR
jgi:hypothetical protein